MNSTTNPVNFPFPNPPRSATLPSDNGTTVMFGPKTTSDQRTTDAPTGPDVRGVRIGGLMDTVASDDVDDAAFDWLCRRRRAAQLWRDVRPGRLAWADKITQPRDPILDTSNVHATARGERFGNQTVNPWSSKFDTVIRICILDLYRDIRTNIPHLLCVRTWCGYSPVGLTRQKPY